MALNVTFTIECHCGEEAASSTTTYLDLNPGKPVVIDADLALGQRDFKCEACGCVLGTGDLEYEIAEHGDECGEPL